MNTILNLILVTVFYAFALYVDFSSSKDFAMVAMTTIFYIFIFSRLINNLKVLSLIKRILRIYFIILAPVVMMNSIIWASFDFSSFQLKVNFTVLVLLSIVYWTVAKVISLDNSNPYSELFDSEDKGINIDNLLFGRFTESLQLGFVLVTVFAGVFFLFYEIKIIE